MHVHFPSSRYFVAFVCVFCVILCVSVPCDKPLCGWSGLPCGWGTLPYGLGYSYCGEENHPVAVVACPVHGQRKHFKSGQAMKTAPKVLRPKPDQPDRFRHPCCGKGHAELCITSDLQVHSDWVIGRLPFCLQNSSRTLFDEWSNALSGRNNGLQSRLCTIYGMFVYNPYCCMETSALYTCQWMCTFSGTGQHMKHL